MATLMGINYSHQKLLGAIITMLATCEDVVDANVDVDEDEEEEVSRDEHGLDKSYRRSWGRGRDVVAANGRA